MGDAGTASPAPVVTPVREARCLEGVLQGVAGPRGDGV
jgi:hypothetical protein